MCETKSFYLWLLQIIGLLGLLALILWLSLRPQSPTVTVVELSVPPIDNASSPIDDGKLSYTMEINNPNKDSTIDFDDILLTFFFGQDQDTAATDQISGFNLGKDKGYDMRNRNLNVDSRLWKAFRSTLSKNGTAPVKVDFSTMFRYKTIHIKSKHHGLKLQGNTEVGKDGKIAGKKKKIKLKHAPKKWRVKAFHFKGKFC